MRLLVQRVKSASVDVSGERIASIKQGLLVFLGIHKGDTSASIDWLIKKLINLRIFADSNGKMNLSIQDVAGELLVVSQFTLYAECKNGCRPDFIAAAGGEKAQQLYESFVENLKKSYGMVSTGRFAADMQVELCNDGPITILLEREG